MTDTLDAREVCVFRGLIPASLMLGDIFPGEWRTEDTETRGNGVSELFDRSETPRVSMPLVCDRDFRYPTRSDTSTAPLVPSLLRMPVWDNRRPRAVCWMMVRGMTNPSGRSQTVSPVFV